MSTAREMLDKRISEADWQAHVIELAETLGWSHYHTYDSRRSTEGFPDLVLVRERVVFAELKREDGKLTSDQVAWVNDLLRANAEVYVWRPSDRDQVAQVLSRRAA